MGNRDTLAHPCNTARDDEFGLTKREVAAIAAMQGFCANPELHTATAKKIAEFAVEQADALFDELDGKVGK